jgi:hypothetical protein
LDFSQNQRGGIGVSSSMPPFLYRCPNTGLNVQGFVTDDPTEDDAFKPITCVVCTRVHLVNPKTGKVLGTNEE